MVKQNTTADYFTIIFLNKVANLLVNKMKFVFITAKTAWYRNHRKTRHLYIDVFFITKNAANSYF